MKNPMPMPDFPCHFAKAILLIGFADRFCDPWRGRVFSGQLWSRGLRGYAPRHPGYEGGTPSGVLRPDVSRSMGVHRLEMPHLTTPLGVTKGGGKIREDSPGLPTPPGVALSQPGGRGGAKAPTMTPGKRRPPPPYDPARGRKTDRQIGSQKDSSWGR